MISIKKKHRLNVWVLLNEINPNQLIENLADFKNFNELKKVYGNASLIADERVVFNIMGNKYRLVVRIVFGFKAIQIKWFGIHAEYDKIDVATVQNKKKQ